MENILKVPYGTRDFLPLEAREKRIIENKLAELFLKWGYKEVVTPAVEYLDTLTIGGRFDESRMYKFTADENKTLALRHEMTIPIARLAASRFKESALPLKLSYISSVYRGGETQKGRQCEFYQAGVELIGENSAMADAETVALAVEGILASGIKKFQISLGEVDFIKGLFEQYNISENIAVKLQNAMIKHNLVSYENIIDGLDIAVEGKNILKEIPYLKGKSELLQKAYGVALNPKSRRALDRLFEMREPLKTYGAAEYIVFDLGLLRDMSYYTGMIFEAYTAGLGFPLCGGGRYDRLLSDFGRPLPATGFALGIERILLAKEREHSLSGDTSETVYVSYAEGKVKEAILKAKEMRAEGKCAELALKAEREEDAKEYADINGYKEYIYIL
ncbi:MAG: ATP phosphoribosyltransferase regulatory subunit [Selenomonadaceae bacterium]|nr:ATP phosphoribosyltransferase regulatory subunit [Selenomonadaceae bacterium]